jgi:hypothetical protein
MSSRLPFGQQFVSFQNQRWHIRVKRRDFAQSPFDEPQAGFAD